MIVKVFLTILTVLSLANGHGHGGRGHGGRGQGGRGQGGRGQGGPEQGYEGQGQGQGQEYQGQGYQGQGYQGQGYQGQGQGHEGQGNGHGHGHDHHGHHEQQWAEMAQTQNKILKDVEELVEAVRVGQLMEITYDMWMTQKNMTKKLDALIQRGTEIKEDKQTDLGMIETPETAPEETGGNGDMIAY